MPHVAGFRGIVSAPSAPAERDASRTIYRYHQSFQGGARTFTRKSLVCAVRLADWSEGIIRPHEESSAAGTEAQLAKLRSTKTQTEAVVYGVRDQAGELERLLRGMELGKAIVDFTTPDGTQHRLWRSTSAEIIGKLRVYLAPKKLHVLEGHDTYEAMLAYRDELAAAAPLSMYSSGNYGLGYLITLDDAGLVSVPRHRVLSGAKVKSAEVLAAAQQHFIVDKLPGAATDVTKMLASLADTVAHQPAFVAVFAGEADAYKLTLSPDISPLDHGVNVHRALAKLDPVVTEHLFVKRHLAGAQEASERDPAAALAALTKGASVALLTRPISIEQIAHVDELGQRLPPHSTAIHPAVAQALVQMPIDRDEDVQ